VLAGGRGTRLAPVVDDRAKVLADVGGRPFLGYLLDQLVQAGCPRIVLCTGYRGDEVRAAVGDRHRGVPIAYSHEPSPAGTGGALRLMAAATSDDPVLVLNGDSYCEVDLAALWARHRARGAAATMVVAEVADTARYGRVDLGADGRVAGFREKGPERRPGWINAGLYVVARARLLAVPAGRPVALEAEVLPAWVAAGLDAFPTRGCFFDIGTPRDYAGAATLLEGQGMTP
jgi:NDP-sugar pyrophosphorylase family protein